MISYFELSVCISITVMNWVLCIIIIAGPQWLPWCGYLINTVTAEVCVDYSRYSFTGKANQLENVGE